MNHRERFLRTLRYQVVDRVPDYEFSAWEQTIHRWHQEGNLPVEYNDSLTAIEDYFHTDDVGFGHHLFEPSLPGNIGLLPSFEDKVLEEKGDHIIAQDANGAIVEMIRPELGASVPRVLRHVIETRKDWEKIRDERLDIDTPGRIVDNLEELCESTHTADYPVRVWCGSLYGWLRNWMGVENISITILEYPEWIEEIMEHLTLLKLKLFERLAGRCRIDFGHWWEDMCYNKGPLISPKLFTKLMVPRYKRVTEFLRRECSCEFHIADSDGNIHELVPHWLECGINIMFPLEAAHNDAYEIVRKFGKRVVLRGYFDKRALIGGKKAIDQEFERLTPLLKRGGFIPHTDHHVSADVSWDNYVYYRQRKCEWIGKTAST